MPYCEYVEEFQEMRCHAASKIIEISPAIKKNLIEFLTKSLNIIIGLRKNKYAALLDEAVTTRKIYYLLHYEKAITYFVD